MSEDEGGLPPFMRFPMDMKVARLPCVFAVNASSEAVWLWVRYPNQVIAIDFEADQAEHLGRGLVEQAEALRSRTRPKLTIIENEIVAAPEGWQPEG